MFRTHEKRIVCIVVLIAVIAVYHAVFLADFVNWDDTRFITQNPLFAGLGGNYARHAVSEIQFEAYQPLHLLSYLPDLWLWPTRALGFHVLNLAIFLSTLTVVHRLASRRASMFAATGATLLFALHPLVVEPVMWITARKDLLALLLVVSALSLEDRDYKPRAIPVGLFIASMLTKSSMVSFPVVLIAWLVGMRKLALRDALKRSVPYWPPAFLGAATVSYIWHQHGMIAPITEFRVLDVPSSFGFNFVHVLFPFDLSPMYPEHAPAWAAVVTAAVALALLFFHRRVPRPAWFAVAAFVAVLLPVSNVVPILRLADRYMLPVLAVSTPALALLIDAIKPRRAVIAAVSVLVLAEGFVSATQAHIWSNSVTLWTRAVEAQPDSQLAHLKLGETLRDAGEFDASIAQYQATIRLAPEKRLGYLGLFYAYATRAEKSGSIPQGTASRWLTQLGTALIAPNQYAVMFGEVAGSHCLPCKDTLLILGLKTWAQPDAELLADAADALDRSVPDEALVFLSEVRERSDQYAALLARANAAYRQHAP